MRRHVGFVKFVNAFLASPPIVAKFDGKEEQLTRIRQSARRIAGEIQRLAPAIDSERVPENSEYPWRRSDRVIAPCNYTFPNLSLLEKSGGRMFLNLMERAFRDFESIQIG